jgi:PEP-CTERM motif
MEALVGDAVFLYKMNVDGLLEEGPLQDSYSTTFSATPTAPANATILYTGGAFVGASAYLGVKDGKHDPGWYLFDLTGWNGIDDLVLEGFWPGQGGISYVSLYGTSVPVPEPATMLLFGTGLIGLATFGRKTFVKGA